MFCLCVDGGQFVSEDVESGGGLSGLQKLEILLLAYEKTGVL